MEKIYKYRPGRYVKYISALHIVAFVALAVVLTIIFRGGYVTAWSIMLILAVVSLMTLSIPRRIVLDEEGLEIQCITEDTSFTYDEIVDIRAVKRREISIIIPLFGSIGFFGYYGRFFNFGTMESIYIYASHWGNFVEITDVYGDKYYLSCPSEQEREEIIKCVDGYITTDTRESI